MNLLDYLREEKGRATDLAQKTGQSKSFVGAVAHGARPCPPRLAVAIEQATDGQVSRKDLLPDWADIWPELVTDPATQASPQSCACSATSQPG